MLRVCFKKNHKILESLIPGLIGFTGKAGAGADVAQLIHYMFGISKHFRLGVFRWLVLWPFLPLISPYNEINIANIGKNLAVWL